MSQKLRKKVKSTKSIFILVILNYNGGKDEKSRCMGNSKK